MADVETLPADDRAEARYGQRGKGSAPASARRRVKVDVACPLDDVEAFVLRFVVYPSEAARVAHVLWIAHTHLMESWESTPRIAFLSPEPGSGKSRALEVSEPLVPLPVEAVNVTPAYLFRKVGSEDGRPTILFDEIDTVFGPRAKDANEEVRGLLNAGHRRHGVAGRCVVRGRQVLTEEIPAYCAVAMAGLGDLPDTILSRSVIVRMRRRAPDETVEPYRRRLHYEVGEALGARLQDWSASIAPRIGDPWPDMPRGITDRNADIWEALLSIADMAGGEWPERASAAAIALVAESVGAPVSLGVRLLGDLRTVFGEREGIGTDEIIKALCALDEAPWADLQGKAITTRGLAQRLGKYGIKSKNVRIGDHISKGYSRADLWDSWQRYLPEQPTGVAHVADVADFPPDGPTGE